MRHTQCRITATLEHMPTGSQFTFTGVESANDLYFECTIDVQTQFTFVHIRKWGDASELETSISEKFEKNYNWQLDVSNYLWKNGLVD